MLSRVADTLYWLSRYIERAENNARMLDVNLQLTLDATVLNHRYTQQHWESIIFTLEDTTLFKKLYPEILGDAVVDFVDLLVNRVECGLFLGPLPHQDSALDHIGLVT